MTAIAIISTLISSIALVGVAVSLVLQARQLRASQIQASRATQVELIKVSIDSRELISDIFNQDSGDYLKSVYVNLFIKYLEMGYSMKVISKESVQVQAAKLFSVSYPYEWWAGAREIYEVEASAKREREFFAIVDKSFHQASEQRQSGGNPTTASESPAPSTDSSDRGEGLCQPPSTSRLTKSCFEAERRNRKYSGTKVEPPSSYVICSKADQSCFMKCDRTFRFSPQTKRTAKRWRRIS